MNHTYVLVWSPTLQSYIPVSETARSRGKSSSRKALRPVAVVLSAALLASPAFAQAPPPLAANALPTGGQVVAGQASIGQHGNQMTITQGSDKAILNWNGFNIGQDARVQFQQPGSASVALNRVVGSDASRIQGQLSANGQVWLVNPNGVMFGPGSRVDVGGLVASTLSITDQDFLDGKAVFTRGSATGGIVNEGQITAVGDGEQGGLIALLAPTVRNDGVLTAKLGNVALAAGDRITLNAGAGGLLQVEVQPGTLRTLVENRQLIVADSGQVVMTGKAADALSGSVVANTGTVQAHSLATREGRIMLLADGEHGSAQVSGLLDASGPVGQGGSIEVTGQQVVLAGATLDASGATGGGEIKVGGGWQGGGALARAKTTSVDATSRLKADATQHGDGGMVVIWSDDKTRYAGHISAKGGSTGGKGGKAEVSGKAVLDFAGTADLSAAKGRFGDLLLDPHNLEIISGSGGTAASGNNFVAATDNSTLGADALTGLLATANVTVSTGSSGTQAGDITVNAAVAWSADTTLTLEAAGNIAINKNITAAGTSAGLELSYGAGKDYQVGEGAGITLSGASATLAIGATGALNTYTLLRNVAALQAIPASSSGHFALAQDINASSLAGGDGFAPIADFGGTFTGLGHVINGLTINRPTEDFVGLFGQTKVGGSTIRDVGLVGANVIGKNYVGALIAHDGGDATITRTYASGEVKGELFVGGLVGVNQSPLSESWASTTVTGSDSGVGGLVGINRGPITKSYATGAVLGTFDVGGLAGSNIATITNSYATGAVSGTGALGGLAGANDGTIKDSYAAGAVSGSSNVGGLVGYNTDTITYSYATGAVSGAGDVGGLVGSNDILSTLPTNSFYATTNAGGSPINGGGDTAGIWTGNVHGTGKTYAGLMLPTTFAGWNPSIWTLARGAGAAGYETGLPALTGVTRSADVVRGTLFQSGMGNAGSPYGITDWQQLANIGQVLAGGYSFNLVNNLDSLSNGYVPLASASANGGLGWNPLGDVNTVSSNGPFKGKFDGKNYTISGLVINRPQQRGSGLFGSIADSDIHDIGLLDAKVSGDYYVGALVGYGLGGNTITRAYTSGEVKGNWDVGGLAGFNQSAVSQSYSSAAVTGSTRTGGVVGSNWGTITQSYATGAISGGSNTGGLVGVNEGTIRNAYATGPVAGTAQVGGLVGNNGQTIEQAYATGTVSGTSNLGGLTGWSSALASPITNAFYATTNAGGSTINNGGGTADGWDGNAHGAGKTYTQLMAPATFAGWGNPIWTLAGGASVAGYETGLLPALTGVTRAIDMQRTTLFQGGLGLAGNPYGITDWQQLANINQVLGGGYIFNLNNNLDGSSTGYGGLASAAANAGLGWNPLGATATPFTGTFDGQDHTISGLVINRPLQNYVGLFGMAGNGSVVRNIGLLGASVIGQDYVGALVGNANASNTISRAYASGEVQGRNNVGGLLGSSQGSISKAYASATVTGTYRTGGLVGLSLASITDSYATGTVLGGSSVGGLVGANQGAINRAYATGSVSGTGDIGGLVGQNQIAMGTVTNAFYATTNAGGGTVNNNGGTAGGWNGNTYGAAKTHAELMAPATFAGWSNTTWTLAGGSSVAGYEVGLPSLTGVTRSADLVRSTLFQGGVGTTGNPYGITDWQQLANINSVLGGGYTFNLGNDLDSLSAGYGLLASATANAALGWKPLGASTTPFSGTFDGQNHTISGLLINRPTQDDVGLFGLIGSSSVVRNIGLLGANVTGRIQVGALVGNGSAGSTINHAYASGGVKGEIDVGGLVGWNQSILSQSYASVTVTGLDRIGGLVGTNLSTITNSYATGAVSGNSNVGGLAGLSMGPIDHAYATGAVSGTSNIGGLIGAKDPFSAAPTNAFYATTNAAGSHINGGGDIVGDWAGNANGTGKTYAELMAPATFAGWDTNIWTLAGGASVAGYETGLLPALTGVTRAIDMQRTTLFQGGMGLAGNAYGITDWQQLANINQVLGGGYFFNLVNNLDTTSSGYAQLASAAANAGLGWKPLGDTTTAFTGTFDGQSRTITGLTIDRPTESNVGLFGITNSGSIIRNVGLVGGSVAGQTTVGGLVGWNNGTIAHAYTTGGVQALGQGQVGGLVGVNSGTISHAYATGAVVGNRYVGGLAGANETGGAITQSYATGSVTGPNESIGGLVGINLSTIAQAYATGAVSGSFRTGGLVGLNNNGTVTDTYATGAVTGTPANSGGLLGENAGVGTSTRSFYATTRADGTPINNGSATDGGWTGNGNGTGKTYAELMSPATFTGWDNTVWTFGRGNTVAGYEVALPALTGVTPVADVVRGTLFQGGMGIAGNPYGITDWQQLANINQVLTGGYTFNLNNHLDGSSIGYGGLASATANGGLGWKTLGGGTTAFTGTFDGKDHTVSGLVINRPLQDGVGLFGRTGSGSVVRNIGVLGANVIGRYGVGALVGYSSGGSTINRAYASGDVNGQIDTGGLVGSSGSAISQSYASATVTGSNSRTGGLVGTNAVGTIIDSYATGAVSGDHAGGLAGWTFGGAIDRAYATGAVSGTSNVGGLVGENDVLASSAITNAFYATVNAGGSTINGGGSTTGVWTGNANGSGKPIAELMSAATFNNWGSNLATVGGSTAIWRIYEGNSTPLLRSFLQAATVTADLSAASKTYDSTIASGTAPYTKNVAGSLLGTLSYASTSADADTYTSAGGTLTLGGLYSGPQGYDISYAPASLTIAKVVLLPPSPPATPSITGALTGMVSKTYDGTTSATLGSGNFLLSGWVSTDGATVTQTTGRYDNANAGSGKTVTVDLGLGDYQATGTTNLGNYILPTQISGAVGNIGKAALTVSANDAGKTYDGQAWRGGNGVSYSGFVNGETASVLTGALTYGGTSQGAVDVGNYLLTANGLNSGNYAIDYRNGTLSVASKTGGGNPGGGNPGNGNPGGGNPGNGDPGSSNPGGGDTGGGNTGGGPGGGNTGNPGGSNPGSGNTGGNSGVDNTGNDPTLVADASSPSGGNLWRALNRAAPTSMLPPKDGGPDRGKSVPNLSVAPNYIRLRARD